MSIQSSCPHQTLSGKDLNHKMSSRVPSDDDERDEKYHDEDLHKGDDPLVCLNLS